jgi:hypothetical protein
MNISHSSNDVQILAENFSMHHQLQLQQMQQLQQMERQLQQQQQQQQQQQLPPSVQQPPMSPSAR